MNNKRWFTLIALSVVAIFLISACGSTASEEVPKPAEEEHLDEESHDEDAHMDSPAEYADLTNPFAGDHEAAEAGALIYEVNCAACHGPEGLGDGPAAEALDPKPASLADAQMMEDMTDGALFWRVREGGILEPFNSAMPPWKDVLSEDETWQVITFLREFAEEDHDWLTIPSKPQSPRISSFLGLFCFRTLGGKPLSLFTAAAGGGEDGFIK